MKKYILLILAIIVLSAGAYGLPQILSEKPAPTTTSTPKTTEATPTEPTTITVTKNSPTAPTATTATATAPAPNVTIVVASTSYPLYAPAGANVIDAMNILASSSDLRFTAHNSSGLGMFIDSINGKENGNGYYWFLYINGKTSETGASQTTLKAGDTVEWRYEKSY